MKRSYSACAIGRSSVTITTLKRSKHTLSSCEISAGDSNNKCNNSSGSSSNSSSSTDLSDNDNVIGKVDDIDSFKKEQELSLCNCTSYHNNIELNDNMRAITYTIFFVSIYLCTHFCKVKIYFVSFSAS